VSAPGALLRGREPIWRTAYQDSADPELVRVDVVSQQRDLPGAARGNCTMVAKTIVVVKKKLVFFLT
jgi:hypothetical protein